MLDQQVRQRPLWPWIAGGAAAALAAFLTVLTITLSFTNDFELGGAITLIDPGGIDRSPSGCYGTGGYSDITEGATVTVYNSQGDIVGMGSLGPGNPVTDFGDCVFSFSVPDVPKGEDFYQVEVSHRGKVTMSAEEVHNDRVALMLGSYGS